MIALLLAAVLSAPQHAEHALNRLAFGPRPGDVERVARMGVDRWIEEQLHPERIADRPFDLAESDRPVADLSAERILRAAQSQRQLNEVMVDFWMNHFNVFAGKRITRELIAGYEHDTIRPRIWGRFEDLLLATAKSPAMLAYLDNARSRKGAINENYARELMELHTLGVDGGYTQKDVTELARVLTGWSIEREEGTFRFRRFVHDTGSKAVLGQRIAAGGGMDEGERMIRFLARHPSTARHLASKLVQKLVADDPPPALVDRVAKRFLDTKGDLRETVRAVVLSPEFRDSRYFRAKVKTPFEYAISAIRAAGANVYDPLPVARELRKLGEPLYLAQPPTGYADTANAWQGDGALLAKLDFVSALAANKLPGTRVAATDPSVLARNLAAPEFQKQ